MADKCDARWVPEYGTEYVCTRDAGHGGAHRGPARAWTGRRPVDPEEWGDPPGEADGQDPDAALVARIRDAIDSAVPDYAKVALVIDLMASAERTGR